MPLSKKAILATVAGVALAVPTGAWAQLVPAIPAAQPAPAERQAAAQPSQPAVSGRAAGGNAAAPEFVPDRPPPPLPLLSPSAPLARREQRNVAAANRWRLRACSPRQDTDGTLAFDHGACEITVVCAPFRVCDVALEPGEVATAVPDVGDPRVGLQPPRFSGAGAERTLHLVFRPSDAGLQSGVSIHTDRRTISFLVVTTQNQYMPLVTIRDPGRARASGWGMAVASGRGLGPGQQGEPCDQPPTVPPSAFDISAGGLFGSAPAWKPTQVYGVPMQAGTATCIEFPADLGSMDAPVLVPRDGPGGAAGIDNVRQVGRRYRVDRLLTRFDLIGGIGRAQESVSVRRKSQ